MPATSSWFSRRLLALAQRLNGSAVFESQTLGAMLWGIWSRILQWVAMSFLPIPSGVRVALQRARGVRIGKNVFLGPGCWIDNARPDLVEIEDDCSLAGRVTVLTHASPPAPLREILGPDSRSFKKVTIKRGAWVTVNCTILPGVTIGENAIIAAGSVVNHDIPANVVAAGVPARLGGRHEPVVRPTQHSTGDR
ncbi:acyltransferase [uncultured Thiodictyon sp.]|uniref:acyltransferase n=1 Tax=uncultured Thiodictyon sp. TaxID=1846217 RepID=UPI0025E41FE5|nr:acyltransferase [uncultured Thiodictyon sp.]